MDSLGERVLFVHAHPDDETLATGAAIARLVADGGEAYVLTLTLGERGEVRAGTGSATLDLPTQRSDELDRAVQALGATRLEPSVRFEDSGMAWGADGRATAADDVGPLALTRRPFDEPVALIRQALLTVNPSAVVTYDADGGYGHPDHEATHDAVATAARDLGVPVFVRTSAPADIVVTLDGIEDRVRAALGAYATQLQIDGDDVVHVGGQREPIAFVEHYRQFRQRRDVGWPTVVTIGAVGVLVGIAGTFAHQSVPPFGVLLAIVAVAGIVLGARLLGSRVAAAAAGAGVLVVIATVAAGLFGRPGFGPPTSVMPATIPGWLWLIVPAVVIAAVLAWPRRLRRVERSPR